MASKGSAWYVDFFRDDYLSVYGHTFTQERAEKESRFIIDTLNLQEGASLLDLCCGQGRHAVELARRGISVTGLDLNSEYLELARRAAAASNVALEAIAGDMRAIPFENHFDAIVNMYSSFGYLESEEEDRKVLESAAKALKPRGQLMLDMLNREWTIVNYIQNDWHSGADGTLYLERRDLDLANSRMHVRFTLVDANGTRRESIGHIIRLYTLTEMTRLLERVGLAVIAVFGGFDGEPYSIGTRRMIIHARRN